jgi:hypothetical protein
VINENMVIAAVAEQRTAALADGGRRMYQP